MTSPTYTVVPLLLPQLPNEPNELDVRPFRVQPLREASGPLVSILLSLLVLPDEEAAAAAAAADDVEVVVAEVVEEEAVDDDDDDDVDDDAV